MLPLTVEVNSEGTTVLFEDIQLCFCHNSSPVERETNVDVKVTGSDVGRQWMQNKDRFMFGED